MYTRGFFVTLYKFKATGYNINMNVSELFKQQNFENIKDEYLKWSAILEQDITFSLKNSKDHTKEHSKRVLLFSLLMSEKLGLSYFDMETLCIASIFHDTRRQNDWLDVGHGYQAAKYYKQFCKDNNLDFNKSVFIIMAYHDVEDDTAIVDIDKFQIQNATMLYRVFKDSDALDRFRFGEDNLELSMLRFQESKSLINFARCLNLML